MDERFNGSKSERFLADILIIYYFTFLVFKLNLGSAHTDSINGFLLDRTPIFVALFKQEE